MLHPTRLLLLMVLCVFVPSRSRGAPVDSAFGVYTSHKLQPPFMIAEGLDDAAMFAWSDQHMAKLGAHWTRFSLLAVWEFIEPQLGGGYDWTTTPGPLGAPDKILGAVYAPGNTLHAVINIQSLSMGAGAPTRSPQSHPTEYAAFVQALAERYDGDGIDDAPGGIVLDHYQLANEHQDWFGRGLDATQYGQAAKATLDALRAANPKAELVMLGGFMEPSGRLHVDYEAAIRSCQDLGVDLAAIDLHWWMWRDGDSPWQAPSIAYARGYLDSLGLQDVEIWSMENAVWAGCPDNQPALTEEAQAMILVKRYVWGRESGLDKLFWSQLLDYENFGGQPGSLFNSMGLVDDGEGPCADPARRNTERVAYWSYQRLAETTDTDIATPAGVVSPLHDGQTNFAYGYLRGDGSQIFVLWREGTLADVTLPVTASTYLATDLVPDRFGLFAEETLHANSGQLTVAATDHPILLQPILGDDPESDPESDPENDPSGGCSCDAPGGGGEVLLALLLLGLAAGAARQPEPFFSRAARTRSGVIGRSVRRMPTAS